ncbi:suppressor APC domain-containing protein 1 [Nothobranchius furzeri]|uniref:Suppressor APC domain containing 1 n=2 Tax=Nothobranchius TaxID=28779 RepID=A0A9D3C2H1_NOTFU|nr:suppressor APC domain-containing protein 1 [Nothobranchius furzeri]KAF7229030.1 suppressor APC domain containing 1 [Nothobranchius furzeri]
MACHLSSSGSYTITIIPLKTSLYSPDALHFYLWIKHLKDLEKEKDALWSGLEILEKARLWYIQRLKENQAQQDIESRKGSGNYLNVAAKARSCLLRSYMQQVNGSLGSVMSEPNASSNPSLDNMEDADLRWYNTVLTQKVSDKNRQISLLEMEKGDLLQQLEDLQAC